MEARLAVLEQIARSTDAVLKEIRDDIRGMRVDQRADTSLLRSELKAEAVSLQSDISALRKDGISAVTWLLGLGASGFIAVFGVLGRHFHWF